MDFTVLMVTILDVIAVNPSNESKIYLLGVPILRSNDGGSTFSSIGGEKCT